MVRPSAEFESSRMADALFFKIDFLIYESAFLTVKVAARDEMVAR